MRKNRNIFFTSENLADTKNLAKPSNLVPGGLTFAILKTNYDGYLRSDNFRLIPTWLFSFCDHSSDVFILNFYFIELHKTKKKGVNWLLIH